MGESFPAILSRLRRDKGVNQRTAAGALHISQALLSHYENGLREPGLTFVCNACAYYGVSADYLLGRSDVRAAFVTSGGTACGTLDELAGALAGVFSSLEQDPVLLEEASLHLSLQLYKLYTLLAAPETALPAPLLPVLCDAALRLSELRLRAQTLGRRLDLHIPPELAARMEAALAALDYAPRDGMNTQETAE